MQTFVAIYRGRTIREAHLVGVSCDPELVAQTAGRILRLQPERQEDPALAALQRGRREALELCATEAAR